MKFNTDGFNERSNYIHNANDRNKLNKIGPSNSDSSVAKMLIAENKPNIQTVNTDKTTIKVDEVKGKKENFVIRNYNMMNVNKMNNKNNPVANALNKNNFNRFNKM